jgi:AcrR family transcriptional regulator
MTPKVYRCIFMKKTAKAPPLRPRNAAATRVAILTSARRAFAQTGYDGAGVREIARGAGVTAMLVNRYFGSKERLFAEVVAGTMAEPTILTPEILGSSAPGEAIAAALIGVTKPGDTPLDGFLIMLRSSSSKAAARIGRHEIEKRYQKAMTGALGGERAAERAALVLSVIAGVQVMRQMIGLTALATAESKVLAKILGPLFRQLVEGR